MDVFDLYAKIALDSSEYEDGLNKSSEKTSTFADKLKSGLATAAKVGAAAITAVTAATTAMTAAVAKGVSDTASYGDNIDKMSQKLGMSAEKYQEWDAVMQHSGTSIDSMQSSMKTLASAAETGNAAFEKLGLTQEQISSMGQEELFSATITALQDVSDETQRTYLASQLLGRGATELGPLLNTSAEDTQAMKDRVHELGGVMSDEAVKAAAAYQDSLQDMQTAISGLQRGLTGKMLPSITTVMDGLTELFSGNGDEGIALVTEGLNDFVTQISEALPQVVDSGMQIIDGLVGAIMNNLGPLIQAGTNIIIQLVTGIVSYFPQLVDGAVQIIQQLVDGISDNLGPLLEAASATILALADGLAEALPDLVPTCWGIVLKIVETLIDNVDQLVDAAIAIITALAEGVINALPTLMEKAPIIIAKLVAAIVKNAPKLLVAASDLIEMLCQGISDSLVAVGNAAADVVNAIKEQITGAATKALEWGKDLMQNFIDGIKGKITALKDTASSVAQTVKNFLGFSEPKEGPLSNFHTYAPDMMELFAKGIRDNEDIVTSQISKSFDFGGMDFGTANVDFASSGLGMSSAGIINSVASGAQSESGGSYTFNLMFPNGDKFASYYLPSIISVAKANGTPIVNPA
jgi:hypothetical protein